MRVVDGSVATTGPWRLGHRPALDGVRGLAILLVLYDHVRLPGLGAAGPAGVTVFFCLSGFLITALLLQEHAARTAIDLVAFYRRRALRLLPALVAFLVVMTAVALALGVPAGKSLADTVPVLLYVGNWVRAFGGSLGTVGITWSLAVEEQFYLVWPVVVLALARFGRTPLLVVAALGSLYAVTARFVLWDGGAGLDRVYFGSDTQALGLLVGCALALVLHHGRRLPRVPGRLLGVLLAGLLGCAALPGELGRWVVSPVLVPLVTAGIIYAVATDSAPRWLSSPALVLVGRRSYGMYLWHTLPVLVVLPGLREAVPAPVAVVLALAATWGLTLLSWRYVEQPFLRLKDRRADRAPAEHRPRVPAA